jgi:hypothetical protein
VQMALYSDVKKEDLSVENSTPPKTNVNGA